MDADENARHAEKMAKIKAARDRMMQGKTGEKGLGAEGVIAKLQSEAAISTVPSGSPAVGAVAQWMKFAGVPIQLLRTVPRLLPEMMQLSTVPEPAA